MSLGRFGPKGRQLKHGFKLQLQHATSERKVIPFAGGNCCKPQKLRCLEHVNM